MSKNRVANVVSISGGKDSTAMGLLAVESQAENLRFVAADTGHEHPATYEYINYLDGVLKELCGTGVQWVRADFTEQIEKKREYVKAHWKDDLMAGSPGRWVPIDKTEEELPDPPPEPENPYLAAATKHYQWQAAIRPLTEAQADEKIGRVLEVLKPTGIPFLDLCLWKGRFSSTRARFCSEELKHKPIIEDVHTPLVKEYDAVISWQGVRKQESLARANLLERDVEFGTWEPEPQGLLIYRPILEWTADEVFEFHRKHGVKWNPLYELGMGRVGCMPCIHARKGEIHEIARRFPEEVARVAEWERLVSDASKWDCSTFMDARVTAKFLGTGKTGAEIRHETHGIDTYVQWSRTSRGGKQMDLITAVEAEDVPMCSSIYGLCE